MSRQAVMPAAELHESARRIRLLHQMATEHAIDIGRELIRIEANLPHRAFASWVSKECEFKMRTARDLMKLARGVDSNTQSVALSIPSKLRTT